MQQSTHQSLSVWTVDDVAAALVDAGRTMRAEQAAAAAASARLCLRTSCAHDHDGSWDRPTTPRAVYSAHMRVGAHR